MREGEKKDARGRRTGERTRVHPLHAVREGLVGDESVAAPAGVGDDCVSVDDGGEGHGEEGLKLHCCKRWLLE